MGMCSSVFITIPTAVSPSGVEVTSITACSPANPANESTIYPTKYGKVPTAFDRWLHNGISHTSSHQSLDPDHASSSPRVSSELDFSDHNSRITGMFSHLSTTEVKELMAYESSEIESSAGRSVSESHEYEVKGQIGRSQSDALGAGGGGGGGGGNLLRVIVD